MFKKEDVAILISRTGENKKFNTDIAGIETKGGKKLFLLSASRDTSLGQTL